MNASQSEAVLRIFDEVSALFHRLRAVAGDVHGRGSSSAGCRGILRSLDVLGPQSVPQLARARPVSRQHVQALVNTLLNEGLINPSENPAHRRSSLLALTAKGRRELEAIRKREARLLASSRFDVPAKDIDRAAQTLRALRTVLENTEWSSHVKSSD
jgi:DNA-binding MarR family transcriptional regulator